MSPSVEAAAGGLGGVRGVHVANSEQFVHRRALNEQGMPPLSNWSLTMGDIELF